MRYFNRLCKVVIENSDKTTLEKFRFKFDCVKSSEPQENIVRIEAFNLSPTLRSKISQEEGLVRLYTGYAEHNGYVELAQGDITKINTNRSEVDIVTEMFLAEGVRKIKSTPFSVSFSKDVSAKELLQKISTETGLTVRKIGFQDNRMLKGGYADIGSAEDILNNLSSHYDFTWSIQNGELLISGKDADSRNEIMLLTPDSGLILNPESVKKISRKLEKANKPTEEKNTYVVQSLLQPQLQIGDFVAIKSRDFNGKYKVKKLTHKGDTMSNDWYTNIELFL